MAPLSFVCCSHVAWAACRPAGPRHGACLGFARCLMTRHSRIFSLLTAISIRPHRSISQANWQCLSDGFPAAHLAGLCAPSSNLRADSCEWRWGGAGERAISKRFLPIAPWLLLSRDK